MAKAEWIPAHLEYDGEAEVDKYFDSRVIEGENGRFTGFFRGHEMFGAKIKIPEGYRACTVKTENRKITPVKELEMIRVWDLDVPSLEMAQGFLDVIEVAKILAED